MSKKQINRRDFIRAAGATGVGLMAGGLPSVASLTARTVAGTQSAAGLTVPKLETVRLAFIGVGARGSGHVEQMLLMDGVEIKAICDTHAPSAQASAKACTDKGRPTPEIYTNGVDDYKRMYDRGDIDAVLIATPWEDHVRMSLDAMRNGIHAFVEVPAATTVDDCWELVETAEKTQKHCMMMENVCYGREELLVLNMCRRGVFGELLHGEAAYIHDLRGQMNEVERGTGSWRTYHYAKTNGNLYPTHGLGPVAQYMNINRGDRFDFLCSVSSPARVREIYASEHFPEDHKWNKLKFICGDINTSIVKTVRGKTLMIQWDEQLPRPYTRHNLIQGTRGVWAGFPDRMVVEGRTPSTDSWVQGNSLKNWREEYEHPLWKRVGEEAVKAGGHGGMDFIMLWRIIFCLRNGLAMDQDVYDAAAWSVVTPMSAESVANRGRSVDFPDFTRGKWKTMKPLDIVS
ncbi:MAG: Gfo/Idh/MocA family oxidoreductase [Armatimonadota bacterium]|nr:Gfo/Idh/MocA family oxidoreductase [Armatimonadota bacterium]